MAQTPPVNVFAAKKVKLDLHAMLSGNEEKLEGWMFIIQQYCQIVGVTYTLNKVKLSISSVRICSCIVLVTFTVYLRSVTACCCLNWVAIVTVDCSCNALLRSTAATRFHYEYAVYSGIRASVYPLVVMYVGTPWE